MDYAIEVNNLVKKYRNGVSALNGLSFNVKKGEIFTMLGPNGAGKSTLINILTTYLKKTSGNVKILGKEINEDENFVRSAIACVSQQVSIDIHLTLMENMIFQSRLYKVSRQEAKERIDKLIKSFNMEKYSKYPVFTYSGGIKRKLDIAMNMVSNPKILFLDEPTVGMDVQSRKDMWDFVRKIRDDFKTTIFLTTHYLEEAEELSDSICIMKEGHELVQGSPESLKNIIKQNKLKIGFTDNHNALNCFNELKKLHKKISLYENCIYINEYEKREDFLNINNWLVSNNIDFIALEICKSSLEDIFLSLVG